LAGSFGWGGVEGEMRKVEEREEMMPKTFSKKYLLVPLAGTSRRKARLIQRVSMSI